MTRARSGRAGGHRVGGRGGRDRAAPRGAGVQPAGQAPARAGGPPGTRAAARSAAAYCRRYHGPGRAFWLTVSWRMPGGSAGARPRRPQIRWASAGGAVGRAALLGVAAPARGGRRRVATPRGDSGSLSLKVRGVGDTSESALSARAPLTGCPAAAQCLFRVVPVWGSACLG